MNYKEAKKLSLTIPWKTVRCDTKNCWCLGITTRRKISYKDKTKFGEMAGELFIAHTADLDREVAKHIVKIHNESLNRKPS